MKTPTLLFPLVCLAWFAGCRPAPEAVERPPRPVVEAEAVARDVPLYLDQIGRSVACETVMIRPKVSGPVTAIHFSAGAELKAGDPLFTIDPRPFQAARDAANAHYAREKARADFDEAQLLRSQQLSERQVVAPQDLEKTRSAELASQAAVAIARAEAQKAQITLDYCEIKSPINGRAGKSLVDVGNIVEANKTDLLLIESHLPMFVEFIIPENELPRVRKYLREKEVIEVEASLPDDPSDTRKGRLDFLDTGVKPDSGTILLRGIFDNQCRFFWPGQFVNIRLLLDTLHGAVLVPASAVQTGPDSSEPV